MNEILKLQVRHGYKVLDIYIGLRYTATASILRVQKYLTIEKDENT